MNLTDFSVFDVEYTSLQHADGHAFAVGAVRMNMDGKVIAHFQGRCPIECRVAPFVAENVTPAMQGMRKTHKTQHELREAFWVWLQKYGNPVFADMGSFADAPFLDQCVRDDFDARALRGLPFPLHEVATLLLVAGVEMNTDRITYAKKTGLFEKKFARGMSGHHPLFDAYISGLCIIQATREIW